MAYLPEKSPNPAAASRRNTAAGTEAASSLPAAMPGKRPTATQTSGGRSTPRFPPRPWQKREGPHRGTGWKRTRPASRGRESCPPQPPEKQVTRYAQNHRHPAKHQHPPGSERRKGRSCRPASIPAYGSSLPSTGSALAARMRAGGKQEQQGGSASRCATIAAGGRHTNAKSTARNRQSPPQKRVPTAAGFRAVRRIRFPRGSRGGSPWARMAATARSRWAGVGMGMGSRSITGIKLLSRPPPIRR